MAYNFFPAGYQPYQNYQQGNSFQNGTSSLIWVQGEAAAKSYPVQAGASVALWDSEADVIYIKSADMAGMPSMKVLDYKIREVPHMADKQAQTDFATKDDLSVLQREIEALRAKFEGGTYGEQIVRTDESV